MYVLFLILKDVQSNTNLSISNEEILSDPTLNTKPFIEGDHIVNATRGQMISMKCIVHNIKNYKVRTIQSII